MPSCEETRLALWPEPGPRRPSAEACEAFDHYSQCESCQKFFALQRELGERLNRAGQALAAPRELRERVYAELAAARVSEAPRPSRWRWPAMAAGTLATAAGLFWWFGRPAPSLEGLAQPFVEEALRDLSGEALSNPDPQQLVLWFAERVGHAVPVLDIPGAVLTGGNVAHIDGARAAALHYRSQGVPLIYFVVPGTSVMSRNVPENEMVTLSSRGFQVVLWREPGAVHVVAAPLGRSELVAIAQECRKKLRSPT